MNKNDSSFIQDEARKVLQAASSGTVKNKVKFFSDFLFELFLLLLIGFINDL